MFVRYVYMVMRSACMASCIVMMSFSSCMDKVENAVYTDMLPDIYPDYIGVTVPAGIAPMDFCFAGGDIERMEVVAHGSKGGEMRVSGDYADFDTDGWHELTELNRGGKIIFTVYVKRDGGWTRYRDFCMYVSRHPLNDYGLTYRKIAPGYEVGGDIGIYQRNIHTFEEQPLLTETAVPGQCMNCHTANRTDPGMFYIQLRGDRGGTLIQRGGKQTVLDMRTDSTVANTSYGCWHPSGDYCAFSTNKIHQSFFTGKDRRIEVYDDFSNVLVLDVRTNELILNPVLQTDDWETYPAFSADGKTLYYCAAKACNLPGEYEKVRYSLCSIGFDAKSGSYGNKVDTILSASAYNRSFTYPRPSYDGRWLMFNVTGFGNFPVNHKDADLWLMDLRTGRCRAMTEVNSDDTESFHSWSSDSHWFVFCSRRENGMYSQLFIASIDDKGRISKPFLLPQRNPYEFYSDMMDSYNCPDFTKTEVDFNVKAARSGVFSEKRTPVRIR